MEIQTENEKITAMFFTLFSFWIALKILLKVKM